MPRRRVVVPTEQLELFPTGRAPAQKERPAREDENFAWLYAYRLYPAPLEDGDEDVFKRERTAAYRQALGNLSELCGKAAESKGFKKYPYAEVYYAWEVLYERYLGERDIPGKWRGAPTLLGVVHGDPPWIRVWRERLLEEMPPVWDSVAHDSYVRLYAHVLRETHFHYGAANEPGRLTHEELSELGLL